MRDADIVGLLLICGFLVLLLFALLATTAGSIASQLLAPVPSIAGPLGTAVSLSVFIFLLFKFAELILR